MQTRSLGRTDLRLSEISLGTWGLAEQSYGKVTPERFDATVEKALEVGVTTFDLSPLWGDGEGERRVGRVLAEARADAVVITRGGARRRDGELRQTFGVADLVADCDGSLARLGREQIDLWLLHNPGDVTLRKDEWRAAVERLEEEGKIRYWGVSVGDVDEARLAIGAGAHAICLTHNLLRPGDLDDLADDLSEAGCGVLARSPLMYGMLAGHWAADRLFAEDDHRAHRWNQVAFAERIRQVNELRFLVGAEHPDLATAALRFVLSDDRVSTAIVGARTPYQIEAAAEAASGPPYLSDTDRARLAKTRDAAGI
jgi:aryl-alcohol dehydrogenase-like predicted oxidoreductase